MTRLFVAGLPTVCCFQGCHYAVCLSVWKTGCPTSTVLIRSSEYSSYLLIFIRYIILIQGRSMMLDWKMMKHNFGQLALRNSWMTHFYHIPERGDSSFKVCVFIILRFEILDKFNNIQTFSAHSTIKFNLEKKDMYRQSSVKNHLVKIHK